MDKYNNWIARMLAKLNNQPNYVVTVGQTVRWSHDQAYVEARPWWMAHEQQHRAQWAKEGWRMAYRYLGYNIIVCYAKNPYEIDANAVADKQYPRPTELV